MKAAIYIVFEKSINIFNNVQTKGGNNLKHIIKPVLVTVLSVSLLAGCNATVTMSNNVEEKEDINKTNSVNEEVYNNEEQTTSESNIEASNDEITEKEEKPKEINLQEVKPNEAGQVMVVMYHKLSDKEADYIRKVENFKEDLRLLYENDYVLVSLNDYINNEIDIEVGKTPVVITFDDGNVTDFNIIEENGKKIVDPNSVVGILEDFHKEHPDFGLEATFFVNGISTPFRQEDLVGYKMNYIIEKGMDIGNHSFAHENLGKESGEAIQETLGKNIEYIKQYLPDYEVNTLALPFGARPKDDGLRRYLFKGSYNGTEYVNKVALAVGWKPEHAPIHKNYDPEYVHRVHGSNDEFGIRYWMDYLDKHPEKRYVSDGDKDIITAPKNLEEIIDKDKIKDKELRLYELNE